MNDNQRPKNCYCHNCNQYFHSMGIARHVTMHYEKNEPCKVTYNILKAVRTVRTFDGIRGATFSSDIHETKGITL